jgi:hypothetical protein
MASAPITCGAVARTSGSATGRLATGSIVTLGVLTLLANVSAGHWLCAADNAGCARAGPPRKWLGRVLKASGAPAARIELAYYFASNRPASKLAAVPFPILTDRQGRYCVHWPVESQVAFVEIDPATPGGPFTVVSPDAGAAVAAAGRGVTVTNQGWSLSADASEGCTTGSPPWYRVDDLRTNWRYRVLVYLPLVTIALALIGTGRRRQNPQLRWTTPTSGALAATGAVFYVLVWITASV